MPHKTLGRKCCVCGSDETYINSLGTHCWFADRDKNGYSTGKWRCSKCYRRIDKNIKDNRYGTTKCYKCNVNIGKTNRYKERDDRGIWTGNWLCRAHYCKIKNDELDSYKNIIKRLRKSRVGNINRSDMHGKVVISQWIGAKTLNLKDLNIEKDNFEEPVDLTIHSLYGMIDVKYATLNYGEWPFGLGDEYKRSKCDSVLLLCMSNDWKNVERVYIIPIDKLYKQHIKIRKNGVSEYDEYKIDEKPFNNTFYSVDIPELFNPFDLWKGKYNKNYT